MSVEGVARSVLSEQVKDRLLQEILSGRYPPETRIVATRVARELGTSQAPVREALRALEAIGVIEIGSPDVFTRTSIEAYVNCKYDV